MLKTLIQKLKKTKFRGLILSISSGSLILLALTAGKVFAAPLWRDGMMVAAALLSGSVIGFRAARSLRNKHVSIDLLVTIATAGALVIGEYWEAAAVSFLFIFGAYLEARTLSRTRQVLQGLLELTPTKAIVLREGEQVEVLPQEVVPGETVLVKPGGKIAVDGEVIEGRSAVNESAITGESMPREKSPGEPVFAGTVNQDGLLKVKATGVGSDTTLARIIRRVEEAQEEKAPTQRFIERFARWYTPFIILLSAGAYLFTRDLDLALTLLVIGCPGALVISTPVSIVAGIGRAAKSGILIKGGEYLENAGKISALALDKTGTITQGKPRVTEVIAFQPQPAGVSPKSGVGTESGSRSPAPGSNPARWSPAQQKVLRLAAVAEAGSEHPLARAILEAAGPLQGAPRFERFETHTGLGVVAHEDGRKIAVGSANLLGELGIPIPTDIERELARLKEGGRTAVLVARDGVMRGMVGIADTVRQAAPETIAHLKGLGLKSITMLTGDDPVTARVIAEEVGIDDIRAGLLPEDKLAAIRELQDAGHVVAMVGDGINDAPALATADLGIAMGAAGTDIAIETADIALMADELEKLPEALRLSKATLRNIRQNVVIALSTVAGLLLGVMLGRIHMAGGMLIHEISVMVVILNGMRLLKL